MVVPVANGVHTREDIWSLPRWDPTLLWYAKAVGALWGKAIADPTSWRYQGAIHGYGPMEQQGGPEPDPLARPGEALPGDRATYWHQCQHGVWYFLPWHRGYLGYFERLIRKTVVDLGGPAEWALPFWNYSDPHNAHARYMRPEFLEATLPDGSPNALFTHIVRGPHRLVATPQGQAGDFNIGPRKFSLDCLKQHRFNDAAAAADFGGTASGFQHEGGGPGALELTPHGAVHNAVGGWMGDFNTAALDPIFWIHHSNIDRLWEVWLGQANPARHNPTDAAWLQPTGFGMPFHIHDETGQPKTYVPADVLHTRSALFAYQYQGIAAPAPAVAQVAAVSAPPPPPPPAQPQLVAASAGAVDLKSAQTIAVRFDPAGPALSMRAEPAAGGARHAYLNFENVTGSGRHRARYVFLDLPAGVAPGDGEPGPSDPYYAGLLPMFGVREGHGLNYTLDVTDVVARLKAEGRWNEDSTTVTLVPDGPMPAGAGLRADRVSLYYR